MAFPAEGIVHKIFLWHSRKCQSRFIYFTMGAYASSLTPICVDTRRVHHITSVQLLQRIIIAACFCILCYFVPKSPKYFCWVKDIEIADGTYPKDNINREQVSQCFIGLVNYHSVQKFPQFGFLPFCGSFFVVL